MGEVKKNMIEQEARDLTNQILDQNEHLKKYSDSLPWQS